MLHIDPKYIVGEKFTTQLDPNTELTCVGYASNDTFLVVGAFFDAPNNRTCLKTFKFQDVKFKGNLTTK
jgi:hypothetical protein